MAFGAGGSASRQPRRLADELAQDADLARRMSRIEKELPA